MKPRRFAYLLSAVAAVAFLFGACAPANKTPAETQGASAAPQAETPAPSAQAVDLMAEIKAQEWPPPGLMKENFAVSLLRASGGLFGESAKNNGNVLISPVSVYLALAMTANGADAETYDGMMQALHAKGLTEEERNAACRDCMRLFSRSEEKVEIALANSIWYCKGYSADAAFLQKNADYFGAVVRALDFGNAQAPQSINAWVKESTRGLIDSIVERIEPDVMMYLINAVYFKAGWQEPFEASETIKQGFETPQGEVQADFMHCSREMRTFDKDGVQGVLLPYEGEEFYFFALLPKEGDDLREYLGDLDGDALDALLKTADIGNVALALPKFKARHEDSLKNELGKLGMQRAFEADAADFSRMSAGREKDLYISEILHKTYCSVDEMGTEAAAVTSVEMKLTGMMPQEGVEIAFDRPFVYGIADAEWNLPLFLGIMENPVAQ